MASFNVHVKIIADILKQITSLATFLELEQFDLCLWHLIQLTIGNRLSVQNLGNYLFY